MKPWIASAALLASLLFGGLNACAAGVKSAAALRGNPQAAAPATLLAGLPALGSLPNPPRRASDLEIELLASAPLSDCGAPNAIYTAGANTEALSPPDSNSLAWAIFGAGGLNADGSAIPLSLRATADADYWLAVSDYSRASWRLLPSNAPEIYLLADGADLVSTAGSFYVAVLGWQAAVNFSALTLTTNQPPPSAGPLELWYYLQTNLQVDANRDTAIAQLATARAAGYTTVLYADTKLEFIDLASDNYLSNLALFRAAAQASGIRIVPNIVSPGYANGLLLHDPNLIEGQPCREVQFKVNGSSAQVVQNPATSIVNGDFETHNGDSFPGWNQMDGPGLSTFADLGRLGGTSIRFSNYSAGNPTGNDRIQQTITVEPWHCYSVNFWLKTAGAAPVGQLWGRIFSADPEFRQLTFVTFPISPTQDWTQYHLIFNSQEKTSVYLYLGIWGGSAGSFWVDDVSIENTGLINLIRRPGAPFSISSADGSLSYSEGSDYDPVSDPLMGQVGYPGNYDLYHAAPAISIPAGSPIQDGDTLKVSYYHAAFTDDLKPACALEEQGVYEVITDVLNVIHAELAPERVFVGVDEHRVAGWSEPGFTAGRTSGQSLAAFTQKVDEIAAGIDPALRIVTWSDMYDPTHNMVASYYLAQGGMLGADAGLSADWDICNWHFFGDPAAPLDFFSARGNRQILSGYYDQGSGFAANLSAWLDAAKPYLNPASGGRVLAVMYTTWANDYSQLAPFAQAVREWEASQ